MSSRDRTSNPNDDGYPDDTFGRGLVLFNVSFFACRYGRSCGCAGAGAEKLFYQGLIQAAAAILHAERRNGRGAASTWRKARTKLETLPTVHMGIALGEFRDALAEFFVHALDRSPAHELPPRPLIRRVPR